MKMLVGLGNPDKKYSKTRHNTGFIILDEIVSAHGLSWDASPKLKSEICKTGEYILVKPRTFMNNSGEAVSLVKEYFGIDTPDICVIHDDVDLPFGQRKEQVGAGHAGHKGVMSIMDSLGTKDFKRIRVGIGRPRIGSNLPVDDFVLNDFSSEELDGIKKIGVPLSENLNFL
ncbi:TPA: aminoacyl-tRNA hydrolase [candidate division WWE3 bacterium]|uniref:Peptidyl-tRNA hydrolase n=1 Tax=candidate division WWE3 bacterium TaxID=2053526 RepID=A0A656PMV0_UNCKA|nr:Peptidyl-tRNA hydrolase [candidate division WWE3 bacterium RAAC2_WWE3_1]KKS28768.1 MAG: Peptidyl-tRNA hydrolase [candidate division WWE3 bacterium GW2011_GWB1_42_117]KKS55085.1 MAG: Peptidyl-tRNA hydrolase [candidate division WWE3 bacterium GW2011_GWD2_42_34]KKT04394.1 MAG: Peptidyl-tRNA hydrolase [candidate division WWE3 bacterium GW2011_GWE2_43_18]KKT07112.1 MAG: Peptidyl-tRNA hydrolase [candidate division WWE3 bacterium GW2011_GWF2_43_18]KKT08661.1 MAG: Peptidyl-tRNA hydrolase [candidate